MTKLTRQQLLADLKRLLRRPDTILTERKLRRCGHATWAEESDVTAPSTLHDLRITFDSRRDGRVPVVIHELLHAYCSIHYKFDELFHTEIEEQIIRALERELFDWLEDHHDRLSEWDRLITEKLASSK